VSVIFQNHCPLKTRMGVRYFPDWVSGELHIIQPEGLALQKAQRKKK